MYHNQRGGRTGTVCALCSGLLGVQWHYELYYVQFVVGHTVCIMHYGSAVCGV